MAQFSPLYVAYIIDGRDVGHGTWAERKARYWRQPWGRKRCLICLRPRRRGFTQLHHLTYEHLGNEWWFELRPLCGWPCHAIVTAVSRALRPSISAAASTYLVWLVARLPLVAAVGALALLLS
jgi:hypothetical protein